MSRMASNRLLKFASRQHGPLAHNAAHKFASNHALCIYRPNAIYSFIPKNACSTMRLSLALANGCLDSEKDVSWIHANNGTFSASLRELVCAEYTFVILRCPFSRLASAYVDKIAGKEGAFWQLYNATGRTFDPDGLSFRAFVSLLEKPHFLNLNIHWKPQVNFLVYEKYDDYFCLEDFQQVEKTLLEKIDLKIVDTRNLIRHGADQFTPIKQGNYSDTPASKVAELKRSGHIPAPETLYDEELIARVGKIYREDIDLYLEKFGGASLLFRQETRVENK